MIVNEHVPARARGVAAIEHVLQMDEHEEAAEAAAHKDACSSAAVLGLVAVCWKKKQQATK